MASEKQIAANRANAGKGGPKTQEGKDRCKMNALRHGLTAKTVVLPSENKEDFEYLRQGFVDSFHPQSVFELAMVEKLANIHWKNNRREAVEAGLLWAKVVEERYEIRIAAEQAGKSTDHITAGQYLGRSFLKTRNFALEKFLRYASSIDREFHKTLDELLRVIKLRDRLACPGVAHETAPAEESSRTREQAVSTTASVLQSRAREQAESTTSEQIGTVSQPAATETVAAQTPTGPGTDLHTHPADLCRSWILGEAAHDA